MTHPTPDASKSLGQLSFRLYLGEVLRQALQQARDGVLGPQWRENVATSSRLSGLRSNDPYGILLPIVTAINEMPRAAWEPGMHQAGGRPSTAGSPPPAPRWPSTATSHSSNMPRFICRTGCAVPDCVSRSRMDCDRSWGTLLSVGLCPTVLAVGFRQVLWPHCRHRFGTHLALSR